MSTYLFRHLIGAAAWIDLATCAHGFNSSKAFECPESMPGVAWRVEFVVPSDAFAAHADDPVRFTTQISEEALHAPPSLVDVKKPPGQLSVAASVGHSRVQLRSTSDDELTLVRVEVLACNATTAVEGPSGVYRRVASLSSALGAKSMKWSAQALNLHSVLEEELATLRAIDESQGSLPALAEYYGMMGDISEEKSLIAGETTAFSRASVWQFGTASRLILGGIVMSDTRDEHIYHEMLVQPALLASNSPRKVLIIGGGEGAALREVLKDTRVQNVTMVEIDKGLVHLCKAHLSPMHHGSFDSPKATITFEDGAIFLQRAAPKTFDVVVIDGIDFQEDQSYGNVLFSHPFYQDVFHVLRPGGVLTQYMSHVDRRDEMVAAGFNDTASFTVDVPSFLGAGARFTVAGKGVQERLAARMVRRVQQRASAGALHDWAYLRPKTMVGSLRHRGRRLKGVVSSSDPRYGTGYVGSADFASARAYAAFVVLHTRRRRGTWLDDPADGCTYPPGTPAAGPEALCQSHFSTYYSDEYMLQCRNCDGCSDEVCVTNIVGCENFLSELYTSCKQETQEPEPFGELLFLLSVLIVASCVCCAFWWCLKKVLCGGAPSAAQQQISEARSSMPTCNGAGLSNLELVGSYTEMSQTMNTTYMLTVAPDGEFAGTCSDAEGIQQIHGKIEWYPGQEVGRIAWQETRPNVTTDALGTIRVLASQVAVDAEYLSTYNGETQGAVSLRSTGAAIMVREAAQESPLLLCCGCGPATAGYQGEEMMPLAAPIS